MLTSLFVSAVVAPQTDERARWGLDALSVVQREFKIEAVPGYADAIEELGDWLRYLLIAE